jgi:hypothetical protein
MPGLLLPLVLPGVVMLAVGPEDVAEVLPGWCDELLCVSALLWLAVLLEPADTLEVVLLVLVLSPCAGLADGWMLLLLLPGASEAGMEPVLTGGLCRRGL